MTGRRTPTRRDHLTAAEADRVGEVFTQHRAFVEAVARQHSPAPDHVADIVQTVAVRVCQGLNGFRDEAQLTSWLYRVTVNAARTYYAAERRHCQAREALERHHRGHQQNGVHPDQGLVQGERIQALHEAVRRLRPPYRAAMCDVLREPAVLSSRRDTRHRARRHLRNLLTDDPRLD